MKTSVYLVITCVLLGCVTNKALLVEVDTLIVGGMIVDGSSNEPRRGSVGIVGGSIAFIGAPNGIKAKRIVHAEGLIVSPGFIDPHTHADADLTSSITSMNKAYLRQGVTTVFIGNDGGGTSVSELRSSLEKEGTGTNVGLWSGHGTLRSAVVGEANRAATDTELARMQRLLSRDMKAGALGLSTGLFYAPGSYASTDELVLLATVAASYGGVYESHIRDESNYTVGLVNAINELIEISERADIPAHVAHIKALGPAVHGQSKLVIGLIKNARKRGLAITADQYPWLASGTRLSNALIPRSAMDGGVEHMQTRLRDASLVLEMRPMMLANLKRRGGAAAMLITGDSPFRGKTLEQLADEDDMDMLDKAIEIILSGDPAIASFMMHQDDVERFLVQPWVVSGSDGSIGHPRKYGSFPKKYQDYSVKKKLLTLGEFVRQSSSRTAEIFALCKRGKLSSGYAADIVVWDAEKFLSKATYERPTEPATGVVYLFVNGEMIIENSVLSETRAGKVVSQKDC